ncbi:MAG: hypothetical protein KC422_21380, partial [Trueperaceae bacterium]|nr:hypothetical protein [Trueperaceae bacterium]
MKMHLEQFPIVTGAFLVLGALKEVFLLSKLSYILYSLLLLSIVFLTSCNPEFYVGQTWQYSVLNFSQNQGTCSGNLKLKVSTEDTLMFESPDVAVGDEFTDYVA